MLSPKSPEMRTQLGPWRLLHELGRGAFGVTYAALDGAGRQAAVKVLPGPADAELRTLRGIAHPCIPAVLDAGDHPVSWVALERVLGSPLSQRRPEHITPAQALRWCAELMDALAHVHHDGWHHGDVKPENLLICAKTGGLRLIDFGLSHSQSGGTPAYAAPEVASGRGGQAADIYSAALVFWELLFGALPWPELGPIEALLQRRGQRPHPEGAPHWQQLFFERAFAVQPKDRATAAELRLQLVDQGARLPLLSPRDLRRRLAAVHVPRPEDVALEAWVAKGGTLGWSVPQQAGRDHQVTRCLSALAKAGKVGVLLRSNGEQWSGVGCALSAPQLGEPVAVPSDQDHRARIVAAAEAICARSTKRLSLLVPDWDFLDSASRQVIELLVTTQRADVLAFGEGPLPGQDTVDWMPWDALQIQALAGRLLPGLSLELGICQGLVEQGEGRPGILAQALVHALGKGALRRGSRGFVADASQILEGAMAQDPLGVAALQGSERELAQLLELAGCVPLEALEQIWLLGQRSLELSIELLRSGGMLEEHSQGVGLSLGAQGRLQAKDPRLHSAVLQWALANDVAGDRILALALGGDSLELAAQLAPKAVRGLCPSRWQRAVHLGQEALRRVPSAELADSLIHAHLCGGQRAEAEALLTACTIAGGLEVAQARCGAGELELGRALLSELGPPEESLKHRLAWANLHFRSASYLEAATVAAQRGELSRVRDPECWGGLALVHAQSLLAQGQAAEALEVASPVGLPEESARILASVRGRVLIALNRSSEAINVLAPLAARGGGLGPLERARTLLNLGTALYLGSERRRAVSAWEESLLLFERLQSKRDVLRLQVNLCLACRESGRGERAVHVGGEAVAGARAEGLANLEAVALGNLGEAHASLKEWDQAEKLYAQCGVLAAAHGMVGEMVELARREAELSASVRRGDAQARAMKAVKLAQSAKLVGETSRSRVLLVLARARLGLGEDIDDSLSELEGPLVEAGLASDLAFVRGWAARSYMELGRSESARALLDRVLSYAQEVEHVELELQALGLLDELGEASIEDSDTALEHLLDLTKHLRADLGLDELLQQVCEVSLELIPDAERAFVALGNPPEVACSVVRVGVVEPAPSMNILRRAVASGREILATDLGERGDLQAFKSVANMRMRSVLCVPLMQGGDSIGALYLDSYRASQGQLRRTARILRGLATFAALAVVSARVREREAQQRRMAESLERALADAKRATQAKDRFLANMSHELRTPLNGILGMLDLLERSPLTQDQAEMLKTVRGSGASLLGLISQVLDYARLEALGPAVSEAPMQLRDVCEGAVGLVASSASAAGVELVLRLPPSLWGERRGDATRLQQVLVNLLDNAVRFSDAGSCVALRVRPTGASELYFEVEDQGCGIPAEALDRIFEPFNQADESNHRSHGGAGLGLSIAREATSLMGGQLQCVSEEGQGCCFHFSISLPELGPDPICGPLLKGRRFGVQSHEPELGAQLSEVLQAWGATVTSQGKLESDLDLVLRTPEFGGPLPKGEILWLLPSSGAVTRPISMQRLAQALQDRLGSQEASVESEPDALGPLPSAKIMVVEDNPINRMVLCRMLRTMGLEIVEAWDGIEALERYSPDMDLILMDCQLPKMDGYEATRRLRAQGVTIPILAVTARAQPGDRALCLDAGMDDYLTKPLALPVLVRALRAWLKSTAKRSSA